MNKAYFILLSVWCVVTAYAGPALANDVTYLYDDLHRVKFVLNSDGLNLRYYYDDNGNILAVKKGFDDADFDGFPDSMESISCANYLDADSDDDGIPDGIEDANHNGVLDAGETDPCSADTDGDGLLDGYELGYTNNDIDEDTDLSVFQPDPEPVTTTDPTVPNGTIYDVYLEGIIPSGTYSSPRNIITRNTCIIPTASTVVLSPTDKVILGPGSHAVLGTLTVLITQ